MKNAEKPDCAVMDNMDHSKMDMNDPVMQAMMKQCMSTMHHDEADQRMPPADHQNHQDKASDQHSEHKH